MTTKHDSATLDHFWEVLILRRGNLPFRRRAAWRERINAALQEV